MDVTHTFDLNQYGMLVRVLLAMALGALIGLDREFAQKPAGLRTHMLVSGAAALLVALGGVLAQVFSEQVDGLPVRTDPVRIIEAVVTGVSFLGAGTIIRNRESNDVEGLTTAASLLFAAAVGVSVALAQWVLATGAALIALFILRVLPWIERRIISRRNR
jgi:putative Mg2+ transporter-C (MgtC) family protein